MPGKGGDPMQENFLRVNPGNPLEFDLQVFATWLRENGYRERVIQGKLELVGDLRKWLGRNGRGTPHLDRKSTCLNSSHRTISYAVFCLKKKKNIKTHIL